MNRQHREPIAWTWLAILGGTTLLLHLLVNAFDSYGIFRDEYYYLACARHLAWGYVDQPPLSLLLLAIQTTLFGESLFALRLLPAVTAGMIVFIGGLLAREFGGGRFAQAFAALLVLAAVDYRAIAGIYSMNVFDHLIWVSTFWLLAKLMNGSDSRLWLALGVLLGLGLLNKLAVLWLGTGIAAGLLLTSERRRLLTPWPWFAAGIAMLLFLPNVIWQVQHSWPTLEFIHNVVEYKNTDLSPFHYLGAVTLEMNPALAPFWLAGFVYLAMAHRKVKQTWAFWTSLLILLYLMFSQGAKAYYASPLFFIPFAAGSVFVERITARASRIPRGILVGVVLMSGILLLPMALPVLSPSVFVSYTHMLGTVPPGGERDAQGELPQFFADRFGWEELAREVEAVCLALPEAERDQVRVFGQNYGQAAALEYWGRHGYQIPPVLSGHNSYFFWLPDDWGGEVMIVLDDERERLLELFDTVELGAVKRCDYCRPMENNLPIWVCRGLKPDPDEIREEVRIFI